MGKKSGALDLLIGAMLKLGTSHAERENVIAFIRSCYLRPSAGIRSRSGDGRFGSAYRRGTASPHRLGDYERGSRPAKASRQRVTLRTKNSIPKTKSEEPNPKSQGIKIP